MSKRHQDRAPGIQLIRIEGKKMQQYPAQPCRLADDGSFEITGVPPGDWDVYLRSSKGNSGSYSSSGTAVAQLAKLREGETRVLDLQLKGQLRSRVSARVFLDGEPFAKAQLVLRGKLAKDATGRERSSWDTVETDAKGGFVRLLEAGTYRATLRIPNDNGARQLELPAEELLSVVAGSTARANFRVQTGRITLQLRDSAGKPTPAARLSVRRDGSASSLELPVAGADGVLRARLPQGSWSLFVMRKELLDPVKGRAFMRMHQADVKIWERMRTLLRRVDVGADESTLRVTLPAAAGY